MEKERHIYAAIDLKSFYASAECASLGLDPLKTNLVVADTRRTEKTIVLAVSPSLKAYGIPGRPRLFQVIQAVKNINAERRTIMRAKDPAADDFSGSSVNADELAADPTLKLEYISAVPKMKLYEKISAKIYGIYLKYVSSDDIQVYSIDEVFIDITSYLKFYNMTARSFTMMLVREVLKETGITATAGVGPNLYLAKIAMDIVAKHIPADKDGVRIAEIDEMSYRKILWTHKPLTDFWRVGSGTAKKLEKNHIYTMGDLARESLHDEDHIYRLFGVNAEYLIDHAWGYEPCTIKDIRAFKPESNSTGAGQVLKEPYTNEKARIIVREMAEGLAYDLMKKDIVSDQFALYINYDAASLQDPDILDQYNGPVKTDWYGRPVPKEARGTAHVDEKTASAKIITNAVLKLYDRITDPVLLIRKISIAAENTITAEEAGREPRQMTIMDLMQEQSSDGTDENNIKKDLEVQKAVLELRDRFGKNAVFKGTDLQEGASTLERNAQIGGHKA
ncbi:MAG: DNA methylase [Lachnospiraceae bacterium]|jgi:DNA polymerase V|nr:DNA methylase [Lachnospiraceae bacterium]MEE3460507.1 DNA methylase [Lachnospiraceae bacterium]